MDRRRMMMAALSKADTQYIEGWFGTIDDGTYPEFAHFMIKYVSNTKTWITALPETDSEGHWKYTIKENVYDIRFQASYYNNKYLKKININLDFSEVRYFTYFLYWNGSYAIPYHDNLLEKINFMRPLISDNEIITAGFFCRLPNASYKVLNNGTDDDYLDLSNLKLKQSDNPFFLANYANSKCSSIKKIGYPSVISRKTKINAADGYMLTGLTDIPKCGKLYSGTSFLYSPLTLESIIIVLNELQDVRGTDQEEFAELRISKTTYEYIKADKTQTAIRLIADAEENKGWKITCYYSSTELVRFSYMMIKTDVISGTVKIGYISSYEQTLITDENGYGVIMHHQSYYPKVINHYFYNNKSVLEVSFSKGFDFSYVYDYSYLFYLATNIKKVNGLIIDSSKVSETTTVRVDRTFSCMTNLEEINTEGWNFERIDVFTGILYNSKKITSFSFGNTTKLRNNACIGNMFGNCESLQHIYGIENIDFSNINGDMRNIFAGCYSLILNDDNCPDLSVANATRIEQIWCIFVSDISAGHYPVNIKTISIPTILPGCTTYSGSDIVNLTYLENIKSCGNIHESLVFNIWNTCINIESLRLVLSKLQPVETEKTLTFKTNWLNIVNKDDECLKLASYAMSIGWNIPGVNNKYQFIEGYSTEPNKTLSFNIGIDKTEYNDVEEVFVTSDDTGHFIYYIPKTSRITSLYEFARTSNKLYLKQISLENCDLNYVLSCCFAFYNNENLERAYFGNNTFDSCDNFYFMFRGCWNIKSDDEQWIDMSQWGNKNGDIKKVDYIIGLTNQQYEEGYRFNYVTKLGLIRTDSSTTAESIYANMTNLKDVPACGGMCKTINFIKHINLTYESVKIILESLQEVSETQTITFSDDIKNAIIQTEELRTISEAKKLIGWDVYNTRVQYIDLWTDNSDGILNMYLDINSSKSNIAVQLDSEGYGRYYLDCNATCRDMYRSFSNYESCYSHLIKVKFSDDFNFSRIARWYGTFGWSNGCACAKLEYVEGIKIEEYTYNSYAMFYLCTALKEITIHGTMQDITAMNAMFYHCDSLTEANLPDAIAKKNTNFNNLFYYCVSIKNINMPNISFESVKDLNSMFYNCKELENINITCSDEHKHTFSNVTSTRYMFYNCIKLKNVDFIKYAEFNANVTTALGMFAKCQSLTKIEMPYSTFENCTTVGDGANYGMFATSSGLSVLEEIDLRSATFDKITTTSYMFYMQKNLKSINLDSATFANVTYSSMMFGYCNNLTRIDMPSATFSENFINMWGMFYMNVNSSKYTFEDRYLSKLTEINMPNADFSKVHNVNSAFAECARLEKITLKKYPCDSPVEMQQVFRNCQSLIYGETEALNWDFRNSTSASIYFSYGTATTGQKTDSRLNWTHIIIPSIPSGCNTENSFANFKGLTTILASGDIYESLDLGQSSKLAYGIEFLLEGLQDVTSGGGKTLKFSSATKSIINNNANLLALVNEKRNLGWTIAL